MEVYKGQDFFFNLVIEYLNSFDILSQLSEIIISLFLNIKLPFLATILTFSDTMSIF